MVRRGLVRGFGKGQSLVRRMGGGSCAISFRGRRARGLGGVGTPCGQQSQPLLHRLAATRAGYDVRGFFGRFFQGSDEQGAAGVKGDALVFGFGRGMAEPIVADRPQAARQDMAQVAFDELRAFEGLDARGVAVGAVLPALKNLKKSNKGCCEG